MKKILMIEDEPGLVMTVGDRLEAEGYRFSSRLNGLEGEKEARKGDNSLIILDIMLPGKDGLSICKALREAKIFTPVLMLTAKSQIDDRVAGLKIGADDYLCKPFDMQELLARIEALIRRTETPGPTVVVNDPDEREIPTIDMERGYISFTNRKYPLSAQEIKLLHYFYDHADRIISRDELLHTVWGYDSNITTRTVDVHIARIRQKLEDVNDVPKYIHTIRGIGYKFTPPGV